MSLEHKKLPEIIFNLFFVILIKTRIYFPVKFTKSINSVKVTKTFLFFPKFLYQRPIKDLIFIAEVYWKIKAIICLVLRKYCLLGQNTV